MTVRVVFRAFLAVRENRIGLADLFKFCFVAGLFVWVVLACKLAERLLTSSCEAFF